MVIQKPTHVPIYLRRGGDRFILTGFGALVTVGIVGALYGTTKMARVSVFSFLYLLLVIALLLTDIL